MSPQSQSDELARLLLRELSARAMAETAQERFEFLAGASTVLASSLDLETTLRAVARLAVPVVADACVVNLADRDGVLQLAAVTHTDPEQEQVLVDLARRMRPAVDPDGATARVFREGRAELRSELGPLPADGIRADPAVRAGLARLAFVSAMNVPLIARGRVLGVFGLLSGSSGRRFGEEDLRLAEDLARRCALAVDNAHLFADARDAAARAERERALLDTFLAAAPVGIAFVDRELRYLHINETLAGINGAPVAAHLGRTVREILPGLAPVIEPRLRAVLENGEPLLDMDFSLVLGAARDWRASYYPVRTGDGCVVGVGALVRDVTAQREVERQRERLLAEEQRAREAAEAASHAKDVFLAAVSHELRTPLTPILAWADLLKRGGLDEAVTRRAVETIGRNARALARLISDLLDFSRITAGKLQLRRRPIDLAEVAGLAVDPLRPAAEAKGITLAIACHAGAGPIDADYDRMVQVVTNLVENAIKFTPAGGRIDVGVDGDAEQVALSVTDTGRGIAPDRLARVFERFHQADEMLTRTHGGLGLGLAIVRELVEAHGGSVEARSDGPDRGAVFTVRLARASGPAAVVAGAAPDEVGRALDGLPVLVVDDERDARDVIAHVLADLGAVVTPVGSAGEALAVFEREPPAVLVFDVTAAPEEALAFIRQLRARPAARGGRTPALALSTVGSEAEAAAALAAGFDAHLAKPIDPPILARAVARLAVGVAAA